MSMLLNPSESFPIVRVLTDNTDSTLYYPQAIVRNSTTGATLATVNLAFVSTRYYMTLWKVIPDSVFLNGTHINIVTTIYTDSAHTTIAQNYYDEVEHYIIQQRWNQNIYTSVGGGMPVDYKEMRKIMKEEFGSLPKNPEFKSALPIPKEFPTKEIVDTITAKIDKIPVPEKVSLKNLEDAISSLNLTLDALPKFTPTDMTPVHNSSKELKATMLSMHKEYLTTMNDYMDKMLEAAKLKFINSVKNGTVDFAVVDSEEQALKRKKKAFLDSLMKKYK